MERFGEGERYDLIEVTNRSSALWQVYGFGLVTICGFLMAAALSVTDEGILREAPITLPIVGYTPPLRLFLWAVPLILLGSHWVFLLHLSSLRWREEILARRFRRVGYGYAARLVPSLPLRDSLGVPQAHTWLWWLSHRLFWVVAWLPWVALILIQWAFLPYRSLASWFVALVAMFDLWLLVSLLGISDGRRRKARQEWPRRAAFLGVLVAAALPLLFALKGSRLELPSRFLVAEEPHPAIIARLTAKGWSLDEIRRRYSRGLDLRGRNLRGAIFTGSALYNVQLSGANVRDASFAGADLTGADLRSDGFRRWPGSRLPTDALKRGKVLADLEVLRDAIDDSPARYAGVDFSGAVLRDALLSGADMRLANLAGADLRGAELYLADLSGLDLTSIRLAGADLGGARLNHALLARGRLHGSNFSQAELIGADFTQAELPLASLEGADVRFARFYGANLRGVNLRNARVDGASFRSARLERSRGSFLVNVDLRGARVANACFCSNCETEVLPRCGDSSSGLDSEPVWALRVDARYLDVTPLDAPNREEVLIAVLLELPEARVGVSVTTDLLEWLELDTKRGVHLLWTEAVERWNQSEDRRTCLRLPPTSRLLAHPLLCAGEDRLFGSEDHLYRKMAESLVAIAVSQEAEAESWIALHDLLEADDPFRAPLARHIQAVLPARAGKSSDE